MLKHQVDEIYRDQSTVIIAVFSVSVDVFQTVSAGVCYGFIEPVSVVICHNEVNIAMDMQAQHKSVNQLCQLVPELQQYL